MTRVAHVDVVGGAAGDMLLAALIDAGADLSRVQAAVDAVLPGRFALSVEPVKRSGLQALLLSIEPGPGAAEPPSERTASDLVALVQVAPLVARVGEMACHVLTMLGEAEADVHGLPPARSVLEELGDDDTLLDVVGISAALDDLGVERVVVSSIPLGSGTVATRHGEVPVPAPAVLKLLEGFVVRPGSGSSETVTPTAAAILGSLGAPGPSPQMRLESTGTGAGTRNTPGVPNVVRVLIGEVAPAPHDDDGLIERDLVVLEANLDDLSPELVADAADALLGAGALDAWTTPIVMKKGRPAFTVSALCDLRSEPVVRRAFFEATSSFGVRRYPVGRHELERKMVAVSLPEGNVRVKLGFLGGTVVTATPEHDDVAAVAKAAGRPVRALYQEAAASALQLAREGTPA